MEETKTLKRVCVFCGASGGARPVYAETARALGEAIAARGLDLVYGGGKVGLMGVVADAALANGSEVDGVIPEALMQREVGHARLGRDDPLERVGRGDLVIDPVERPGAREVERVDVGVRG